MTQSGRFRLKQIEGEACVAHTSLVPFRETRLTATADDVGLWLVLQQG